MVSDWEARFDIRFPNTFKMWEHGVPRPNQVREFIRSEMQRLEEDYILMPKLSKSSSDGLTESSIGTST